MSKNERAAVADLTKTVRKAFPRMSPEQAHKRAVAIAKKHDRDKRK